MSDTRVIVRRSAARYELLDLKKSGLVSAYDFYQGSLADLVSGNNGTKSGVFEIKKDRIGRSWKGYGSGSIGLGTGFNSQVEFFASCWYTHKTTTGYIFNQYKDANNAFGLRVASDDLQIVDDINNAGTLRYSKSLIEGYQYHIIFGINSAKLCKAWVNSVPLDNDESAALQFSSVGGSLYIGQRGQNSAFTVGAISNIEIFNTDITDADAAAIYQRARRIKTFFADGVVASETGYSSGNLENTPIQVSSGEFKIVDDGSGKYIECSTAGQLFIPRGYLAPSMVQGAFGTWNFHVYKTDAGVAKIGVIEGSKTPITSGYHVELDASENIKLIETGGATHISGSGISADAWNTIRCTRRYDGLFTLYLAGTSKGTATDTTVVSSYGIGIEMDAGDRFGLTGDYRFWWSPIVTAP